MPDSLFERLGGEGVLLAAVHGFYERVLADERVSGMFSSLSLDAQVGKQLSFMTHAFGGPTEYRGRDLAQAHAKLVADHGLGDAHFDIVVEHLVTTLRDLEVAGGLVDEVRTVLERTRASVLGRLG